jgi:hypothetical protein
MPSPKPKTPPDAYGKSLTTEPESHVRMRKQSAAQREAAALAVAYGAGEIDLDTAIARLKAIPLARVGRYLTENEKEQLDTFVADHIDIDAYVEKLRALGPRK